MLTVEKVAVLKGVDIFSSIPDFILASVAAISEEVELSPGETLITEGELGDCMYIIVNGEVRVHSQNETILHLGSNQIVGELAVLDPEPRAASVSAVKPTLLLGIEKDPFDEVMADRPEIAQCVITVLCRRIRAQGRALVDRATVGTV